MEKNIKLPFYIYLIYFNDKPYLSVRVPCILNGVKKGYWTQNTFSIEKYGHSNALKKALVLRNSYLEQNSELPSKSIVSKKKEDYDESVLSPILHLYQLQKKYGDFRPSTLPFLAIFSNKTLSTKELCELLDLNKDGIRSQLRLLTKRNLLMIAEKKSYEPGVRSSNYYAITDLGREMILAFRKCMNPTLTRKKMTSTDESIALYQQLNEKLFTLSIVEVAVMLCIDLNIISVERIREILQARQPMISSVLKKAEKKGFLTDSGVLIYRDNGSKVNRTPHYQVTDEGYALINLLKRI